MSHEDEIPKEVLDEIYADIDSQNTGLSRLLKTLFHVNFLSRSNGKNRRPRKHPREVELLLVSDQNFAYQIKDGEVKARKKAGSNSQPDQIAAERLTHLAEDERTPEKLIEIAKKNRRIKKK